MNARVLSAVAVLGAAGALAVPCASALAADPSCQGDFTAPGAAPPSSTGAPPLRFGIYPGGTAGQVGVPATAKPDQPDRILAALAQLRPPGRPFTVHIYRDWTGDAQAERA